MLASRALDQAGHRESAVAVARDAEQTFARCGARRERDGAAFELRRLGARAPARAQKRKAGGLTSLSPREFEVAELVAAGHGNRQIAALLFVSENTVESHLRRIFAKLDIRSRAALASALERSRAIEASSR